VSGITDPAIRKPISIWEGVIKLLPKLFSSLT
jgi:hypothetical protein